MFTLFVLAIFTARAARPVPDSLAAVQQVWKPKEVQVIMYEHKQEKEGAATCQEKDVDKTEYYQSKYSVAKDPKHSQRYCVAQHDKLGSKVFRMTCQSTGWWVEVVDQSGDKNKCLNDPDGKEFHGPKFLLPVSWQFFFEKGDCTETGSSTDEKLAEPLVPPCVQATTITTTLPAGTIVATWESPYQKAKRAYSLQIDSSTYCVAEHNPKSLFPSFSRKYQYSCVDGVWWSVELQLGFYAFTWTDCLQIWQENMVKKARRDTVADLQGKSSDVEKYDKALLPACPPEKTDWAPPASGPGMKILSWVYSDKACTTKIPGQEPQAIRVVSTSPFCMTTMEVKNGKPKPGKYTELQNKEETICENTCATSGCVKRKKRPLDSSSMSALNGECTEDKTKGGFSKLEKPIPHPFRGEEGSGHDGQSGGHHGQSHASHPFGGNEGGGHHGQSSASHPFGGNEGGGHHGQSSGHPFGDSEGGGHHGQSSGHPFGDSEGGGHHGQSSASHPFGDSEGGGHHGQSSGSSIWGLWIFVIYMWQNA